MSAGGVSVRHADYSQIRISCNHDGTSLLVNIDGQFWDHTYLDLGFERIDRTVDDQYFPRRGPKSVSRYWTNKDDFSDWGKKSKFRVGKKKATVQRVMIREEFCLFFVWYDHVTQGLAREMASGMICNPAAHPSVEVAQEILKSISLTEAY